MQDLHVNSPWHAWLPWLRSRVLTIAVASALLFVQTASAQQAPSQILDQYRAQRVTWTTNIWPYANNLFGLLALIEFAWSAAVMLLEKIRSAIVDRGADSEDHVDRRFLCPAPERAHLDSVHHR